MPGQPLVLFDMDGTLLDTRLDIAKAANDARAELSLPPLSIEAVVRAVGDGVNLFVSRVTYPEDHALFTEARSVFLRHYALNVTGDTTPYEGIQDLLCDLQRHGVPMAVVSNKPEHLVDQLVRHHGWEQYFCAWLGGDSAAKPKPAIEPLLMALERCGFAEDYPMIMVGDGQQDIMAAKSAGCPALWCAWGFNSDQPSGHPSILLSHPREVLDFLGLTAFSC